MRDVPLDAARDPRANQPDQRRLDDVLAVDEVVAVRLVDAREDAAADLRRDADLHVLVLEVDQAVRLVDLAVGQVVVERIRIDAALGSLRHAPEVEHRVGVRRPGLVRGDDLVDLADGDGRAACRCPRVEGGDDRNRDGKGGDREPDSQVPEMRLGVHRRSLYHCAAGYATDPEGGNGERACGRSELGDHDSGSRTEELARQRTSRAEQSARDDRKTPNICVGFPGEARAVNQARLAQGGRGDPETGAM